MKCPLLFAGENAQPSVDMTTPTGCLQEDCAWWDEEKGCCLLRTLTKQVSRLADRKEDKL